MADLLARIKIPVKILGLLLMLGLITLSIAFYGARALVGADSAYEQLVDHQLPGTTKLARVNRFGTQMLYASYRVMAYPGGSAAGRASAELEATSYANVGKTLDEIKEMNPDMAAEVEAYRGKFDEIHKGAQQAIAYGSRDQNEEARQVLAELDTRLDALAEQLTKANNEDVANAQNTSNALTDAAHATSTTMLIISAIAIAIAIGIGLLVSRLGITTPIADLQARMKTLAEGNNAAEVPGTDRGDEIGAMAKAVLVFREAAVEKEKADAAKKIADAEQQRVVQTLEANLDKLAHGDLTSEINEAFSPAYESVKVNFNAAVAELRSLIGTVMESAATIRTGSGEIAQASEDLARRTEANAASLEETSAAVTQMDGRLKATAQAAGRTVERADGAIATVSGGRTIADEAVQAMSRVADGAKGIDSVIEGLDKIAFQTRVLAMNAAVEAGRAGEAGRGFAVVADLVSALAMRSEEEAARARDQLTATQTDIVSAVEMVQKVDTALADISGDVGEVHTLLAQMATDNHAQSTAITQISVAIGTMDQSTQQNAAMVEETSAAARNLTSEVAALSEQASKFNVGGTRAVPIRATTPAKPAAKASGGYVSPVKALPVAAMASGGDDWASF
ncbi:methyl-accepting chemotaxis protein [Sphingomonas naasensis]|uniref:Methyl-accepting chemotaxis protein n=1 Tax=Sphingomonas naasensis TaxID=1344951 RepID=A0A4S1WPL1_9SPHN|nr:methyl-accepting chemotaxis protein [Sphingomonas naasensis]NIJ20780.1 methyl-accepting chemotaxis protein [Sphingomonas naasensis]TGX43186.1 methyl-accepting chemotaxis protein [Sphingomonas naasensis]